MRCIRQTRSGHSPVCVTSPLKQDSFRFYSVLYLHCEFSMGDIAMETQALARTPIRFARYKPMEMFPKAESAGWVAQLARLRQIFNA